MTKFGEKLKEIQSKPLVASNIEVIQVNVGYRCNMSCKHCHVEAGPHKDEVMDRAIIDAVLDALKKNEIRTLDITGGAPEFNPYFRYLVHEARKADRHVVVRSNLTIFFEEGMGDLPTFYRERNVEVIASLPYYIQDTVDRVRGNGTFRKSIEALKTLNSLGYGNGSDEAVVNLVYNPQGAFLPAMQSLLEEEFKKSLYRDFGISFNRLYTFTNMPVGRFRDFLVRTGNFEKYMEKLSYSFNPETLDSIMCRHVLNIGWDGRLYDCDFNQMMGLELLDGYPQHVREFAYAPLSQRKIAVDDHCYGCTAGQGST